MMNKEKIKTIIQGAVLGAALTMIVGFNWGGWVTGGTSTTLGEAMAKNAVVERLAPMCVEQFQLDPEKEKKLKEFKDINSWDRDSFIETNHWAIMPFEEEHDHEISRKCSDLIYALN